MSTSISSRISLLLFLFFLPSFAVAEDLVGLKNLSWEEQKFKTRIILETTQPLQYKQIASQTGMEIILEITNLDLRNLPQELFINTSEVVSLQTFPSTGNQDSRVVVKLNAHRPHQILAEKNKLYIDVEGNPNAGLSEPINTPLPPSAKIEDSRQDKIDEVMSRAQPPAPEITPPPPIAVVEQPVALAEQLVPKDEPRAAIAEEVIPNDEPPAIAPATEVRDVQISPSGDSIDIILIGNGSFHYDVFELSNPERLVVDLKSVVMAPSVQSMVRSGEEMFSKVRLAQYQISPKIVRAVIDLNRKVPYEVISESKQLRIHLGEQTSTPVSTSNETVPEPADSNEAPSDVSVIDEKIETDVAQIVPEAPSQVEPSNNTRTSNNIEPSVKIESPNHAGTTAAAPATPATATPPAANDNEQFFAFQPDTSLFAQETTTQPPPATTTTTGQGMGTFQERTLIGGQKQYTGEPFSFDFKDIDIKDLFRFIADISGLNVILDPGVRGSVTLKLTDVPWDQALDLITKNQGLGYTIEGNVIRIAPISKIAQEERARRDAQRERELSAPLVTKLKPLSYARAQEVNTVIRRLLTAKGTSIVDRRTNTLIITDIDTNIDAIINLIDTLDSRTAQVVIEARIVETTKNFAQSFGIQWGFRGIVDPAFGNNTTLQFPNNILVGGNVLTSAGGLSNPLGGYAVNLPGQGANTGILLSAGNILDTFRLDIALTALETSGNGRILSSPKVTTQNNTRAEILQGTQIPVQTLANNTITTTFVNAALRLSVEPQITAEGTVVMDVEIQNNRPDFANVTFTTPPIIVEQASTTLLVDDGGTAVIGGIFTARDDFSQNRTPVLHRIPLLGWLFKNYNVTRENRELLIFLTPRIIR